jgi:hypothetical protein
LKTKAQPPVAPSRAAAASCAWRFVAQRLHQPADAEAVLRRAEQDRHDLPLAGLLGEVVEHGLPVGRLVHQQLLEQGIVMVGELLQHVRALQRLAVGQVGRDVLLLGGLAGPIIISSLQGDIDEARDLFSIADRDPAGDQGRFAHRLQRLEQGLDRAARLIDLVDEDHVRKAERLEPPQRRLCEEGAGGIGIDDDQSEVCRGDAECAVGGEADGARHVDQGVAVAHIVVMDEVELGGAAAGARLRARIADAGAVRHRALPPDRAGRKKKGLG